LDGWHSSTRDIAEGDESGENLVSNQMSGCFVGELTVLRIATSLVGGALGLPFLVEVIGFVIVSHGEG